MKLHNFFRSGTSHRVRIAMALKNIDYDYVPVSLPKEEHDTDAFAAINPQRLVPVLETEDGTFIQSLSIIEFLEQHYPTPALYPLDPEERIKATTCAHLIACDIHPVNNRRILMYLRNELAQPEEAVSAWIAHWIAEGFQSLEKLLENQECNGRFCVGSSPSIADVCLIPQVESARRFNVDMSDYPLIASIDRHCNSLDAFVKAAPQNQPDAL